MVRETDHLKRTQHGRVGEVGERENEEERKLKKTRTRKLL
jgi:hypothetical protein